MASRVVRETTELNSEPDMNSIQMFRHALYFEVKQQDNQSPCTKMLEISLDACSTTVAVKDASADADWSELQDLLRKEKVAKKRFITLFNEANGSQAILNFEMDHTFVNKIARFNPKFDVKGKLYVQRYDDDENKYYRVGNCKYFENSDKEKASEILLKETLGAPRASGFAEALIAKGKYEIIVCWEVAICWNTIKTVQNDSASILKDIYSSVPMDFVIKLKNDEEIKCHKSVLAAQSAVFLAMINSGMMESRTNVMTIEDVEKSTMERLVPFFYGLKFELSTLSSRIAVKVFLVAHRFDLKDLLTPLSHLLISKKHGWYDMSSALELFKFCKYVEEFETLKLHMRKIVFSFYKELQGNEWTINTTWEEVDLLFSIYKELN